MVKALTFREYSEKILDTLKDEAENLKVPTDYIKLGKYGSMPSSAPGILIYPILDGTTNSNLAITTTTIFCLESDVEQEEAMYKSVELAGKVLKILSDAGIAPPGTQIGFDANYSSITASYLEFQTKVRVS